MKYTSEKVFVQSLKKISENIQTFFIISNDNFEREYFCKKILESKKISNVKKFFGESSYIEKVFESITTPSLFSEDVLVFF